MIFLTINKGIQEKHTGIKGQQHSKIGRPPHSVYQRMVPDLNEIRCNLV